MRKILHLLFCCFISISLQSQEKEFWGLKYNGGNYENGVIFKTNANGDNYQEEYSFLRTPEGGGILSRPIQASNGKYYGMVDEHIYEFDEQTGAYTVKFEFNNTTNYGRKPESTLIEASNGKLYGTTTEGGIFNDGVLFEFDYTTNNFIKRIDFRDTTNGQHPWGNLLEPINGKIYGVTLNRGDANMTIGGTLYEYDIINNTLTIKVGFTTNLGVGPTPGIFSSNGKIYGTTLTAGPSGNGTLYEYDLVNDTIVRRFNFPNNNSTTGGTPQSIMQASNGKFYGTTRLGGVNNRGVFFEFDPTNSQYTNKYNFTNELRSASTAELVEDSSGNLYGFTDLFGTPSQSKLYQYNIQTDSLSIAFTFNDTVNAFPPTSPLRYDANKNSIRGLSEESIFEFNLSTNTYQNLFRYDHTEFGRAPIEGLLQASNGKLYGICVRGGDRDQGVLFEYNPINQQYQILVDFAHQIGEAPSGPPIEIGNGRFYGLTQGGGKNSSGIMYEYDLLNHTYTVKAHFDQQSTGLFPAGSLLDFGNGKFYGVTFAGGSGPPSFGAGVLFEYDNVADTLVAKHHFNITNGFRPIEGLTRAYNGNIYGTTSEGGVHGDGVLFEYNPVLDTLIKRFDFDDSGTQTGYRPNGSLLEYDTNKLIGATLFGGVIQGGTYFEYNTQTDSLNKLRDVSDRGTGSFPSGGFLKASNGQLYSMSNESTFASADISEYNPTTGFFLHKIDIPTSSLNLGFLSNYLIETEICYNSFGNLMAIECSSYTTPNQGRVFTTPGNYTVYDTLPNACGGDSIVSIDLTIYGNGTRIDTISACESFTWIDGNTYGVSTDSALFVLPGEVDRNGCDSIARLDLTIIRSSQTTDTQVACKAFTWIDGNTYTANTDSAQWVLSNAANNGCDSIITLNLTIINLDTTVSRTDSSLIANITTNASYQWLDCNNGFSIITGANEAIYVPKDTGSFAVEIRSNNCIDTSACFPFSITNVKEVGIFSQVQLYPNPTQETLHIQLGELKEANIRIYDAQGKLIQEKVLQSSSVHQIELLVDKGIYLVELEHKGSFERRKMVRY